MNIKNNTDASNSPLVQMDMRFVLNSQQITFLFQNLQPGATYTVYIYPTSDDPSMWATSGTVQVRTVTMGQDSGNGNSADRLRQALLSVALLLLITFL